MLLIGTLALAAGCEKITKPSPPARLEAIGTAPQTAVAGSEVSVAVRVMDSGGKAVRGATVQWAVTGGGGALGAATSTTDAQGEARATWTLGPGVGPQTATATVASLAPVSWSLSSTAGSLARVTLSPDSARLSALGDTLRFRAVLADAFGNPLPPGQAVSWMSLDTAVVSSSPDGLVRARANGQARLVASAGGRADTAIIRVAQTVAVVRTNTASLRANVGDTVRLSATAADANGSPVAGTSFTWSSSDTTRARVSPTGLVTAIAPGEAVVSAASGGQRSSVAVVVASRGTMVSGVLASTTRWAKASGPYRVTGNILVPGEATLTIEPGTRVLFEGAYYIKVEGTLIAIGTPTDSVVFTSGRAAPAAGDWGQLWFTDGSRDAVVDSSGNYQSGSAIRYAEISYGGALHFDASSPYFANNRVHHVRGSPPRDWPNGAIWTCNSGSVIRDNLVEDNPLSAIVVLGGAVQIRRNTLRRNSGHWGGGIFFANANCGSGVSGTPVVEDNTISENRAAFGGGIALYSGAPRIRHNRIVGNLTTGALASGSNAQGNGAAIAIFNSSSPEITFNQIENNSSTAPGQSTAFFFGGGFGGRLQNNNIANPTTYELYLNLGATGQVDARNNFWGTLSTADLDRKIWDFSDNFELGRVVYLPILTAREASAGPR